jgi:hypothetical protein
MRTLISAISIYLLAACSSFAADRVTITGNVVDASGQPVDHATVLVWHAGVKRGYSTYCPSCYVDCGKRTMTAHGAYTIKGLDPDLKFELLIVREGYIPAFVGYFDPSAGPAPVTKLKPRAAITDPTRVVRGRVVNSAGRPLPDAVVEPQGVMFNGPQGEISSYGTIQGLEPIAVTDANGDFELAFDRAALGMVVQVEARGMAPGIFNTLSTGPDRHTVTVTEGSVIRGRMVRDGKPVGGAEVGLIARQRAWGGHLKLIGFPYSEIRVGTQPDGTFTITNVPPGVEWYVYGRMGSIPNGDAVPILECATKGDGDEVNIGDLPVGPGRRLRGRVILADGKPVASGMRVTIGSDRAFDSQTALLQLDGKFEFSGLRDDGYTVFTSIRGYEQGNEKLTIDRDIDDFTLTLAAKQRP